MPHHPDPDETRSATGPGEMPDTAGPDGTPGAADPYEVAATGETYRVVRQEDDGVARIGVYSRGQLRFSLPGCTRDAEVRTFVQVYALGFADGQGARSAAVEDHIRGRLNLAARRLGQAVGKLKAGS
jgi:hypothetical protein